MAECKKTKNIRICVDKRGLQQGLSHLVRSERGNGPLGILVCAQTLLVGPSACVNTPLSRISGRLGPESLRI